MRLSEEPNCKHPTDFTVSRDYRQVVSMHYQWLAATLDGLVYDPNDNHWRGHNKLKKWDNANNFIEGNT